MRSERQPDQDHALRRWLSSIGLGQYAEAFERDDVGLELLVELSEYDLEKLGLTLGHRKKLLKALAAIRPARRTPDSDTASTAPGLLRGERRQLTVLFCDLVGSTVLSQQLDPEAYSQVVRTYQAASADVVRCYDGYIAQYLGDGLLIYFGYPGAHEDDAERAVSCALDLIDRVSKVQTPSGALAVRTGIHTGVVVVDDVGQGTSQEQLALGDTPNVAARLQSIAQPNTVVLSDRTRQLVAGSFECFDMGQLALHGVPAPLHAWQALKRSAAESRFDAATRGSPTPMVGRELEISILRHTWRRAASGKGQFVLLSGEPGIGKSRLLRALREDVVSEGNAAAYYQCTPYYSNSALHPVIQGLHRMLKIESQDDLDTRLDKLEHVLARYNCPRSDMGLIANLLSLPSEQRYGTLGMTPRKQKDETFRALYDLAETAARQQPLLMLFEDVHWADPTTLEYLGGLLERMESMRLLVLVTHRPEFKPQWVGQPLVTAITLSRLASEHTESIARQVAGESALPRDILAHIVTKTDGIPLFIEEITKAIVESGLVKPTGRGYESCGSLNEMTIPTTLRDSLMARLDRLAPTKEVAQTAACMGREFHEYLLSLVSPLLPHQLEQALEALVAAGLMFKRGESPNAIYSFKHALIQEAAYDSLLKSRRQQLHGTIADVLEKDSPVSHEIEPELLAHHYTEAGIKDRAICYWRKAGESALQRSALQEAIAHLAKALALVESLPSSTECDATQVELRTLLGWTWIALRGWTALEISDVLIPALPLAKSLPRQDALLSILTGLSVSARTRGRNAEALDWVNEMFASARKFNDSDLLVAAHGEAMAYHFWRGELLESQKHGNEVLALHDATKYEQPVASVDRSLCLGSIPEWPQTYVLNCASHWTWMLGYPERAVRVNDTKDLHARTLGKPWNLCFALGGFGSFLFEYLSEPEVLLRRAEECEHVAKQNSLSFFVEVQVPRTRAVALIRAGELKEGIDALSKYIDPPMTTLDMRPYMVTILADAVAQTGDLDRALRHVTEAIEQVQGPDWQGHAHYAEALRIKAGILARTGRPDDAEVTYLAAIEIARKQQAKSWELRSATDYARFLELTGRSDEALQLLQPVYEWFTEGRSTKDHIAAKALVDELRSRLQW